MEQPLKMRLSGNHSPRRTGRALDLLELVSLNEYLFCVRLAAADRRRLAGHRTHYAELAAAGGDADRFRKDGSCCVGTAQMGAS